jgi:uncharacterized protein YuzE
MRVTFDGETDVGYIQLVEPDWPARPVRQVVAEDPEGSGVVLEFDADGRLLGVELLSARHQLHPDLLGVAERIG